MLAGQRSSIDSASRPVNNKHCVMAGISPISASSAAVASDNDNVLVFPKNHGEGGRSLFLHSVGRNSAAATSTT